MVKSRRRAPRRGNHTKQAPELNNNSPKNSRLSKYYIYLVVAVLAGIPFFIGKYIEFNTPGPYDSGSYVYSAQHIAEGAKLGVDEIPSAKPMTLLINFVGVKLFGFSETGPLVMQALLQLAALLLMFLAVRKMFGSLAAVVSVTIAAIFLSSPLVAKFGNVKEQFMISFMVITASCFILRQLGGKWWWALLTGAFAVNIYYFKPTGLSVITAIVVYMLASVALSRKKWRPVAKDLLFITAGAFAGLIPLLAFYAWQDALPVLLETLPAFVLFGLLQLAVFGFAVYVLVRLAKYVDLPAQIKKLKHVRKPIWIGGAVAVAVVFIPFMYFFHSMVIVDTQFEPVEKTGYMKYYNPDEISAELKQIDDLGYMEYYKSIGSRGISLKRGGELNSYLKNIAFIKYPKMAITYPVNIVKGIAGKFGGLISKVTGDEGYVSKSHQNISLKILSQKVFRFYRALILPVSLALASIAAGLVIILMRISGVRKQTTTADRLVIFLAVWWILDMAFVWISPRSYEQYYLPLIASAAVLAGYICSFYSVKFKNTPQKAPVLMIGGLALVVMVAMSRHIFFGFKQSPHTGKEKSYKDYGYAQALKRVARRKDGNIGGWEHAGEYINDNSNPDDRIYVWGWYPGIYVKARRLSSARKAFESEMHIKTPQILGKDVEMLLQSFEKNPPEYIVDSRKNHFPWDRPPLELWPTMRQGLLQKNMVAHYDKVYKQKLSEEIDPDEAARFEAMAPFRNFVMENYEPVKKEGFMMTPQGRKSVDMFYPHRVFRLKQGRK